jgi:hypothetical protein
MIAMKRLSLPLLMIWTIGCISSCLSPSYPPVEELLVDTSVFPEGWSASPDGPYLDPAAPFSRTKSVDRISISFYAPGGGAGEEIQRFKSTREAKREFARKKKQVFRVTGFNTPWEVSEELSYESPIADEFHYACSWRVGASWPDCAYIARYGTYFVHFDTDMLPGYMSYADLENILEAIDERMGAY